VRAGDIALAPDGEGVRARIERAVYQGGYFRLEARTLQGSDTVLRLEAPEPMPASVGGEAGLHIVDGWVLPDAGR
jgi:hypothetical protein